MPWGWKNPECRNSSRFTATADFLSADNSDIAHYMEQTGGQGKLYFPGCAWKGRFRLPSPFHRPFGSFFRTCRHRSTGPLVLSPPLCPNRPKSPNRPNRPHGHCTVQAVLHCRPRFFCPSIAVPALPTPPLPSPPFLSLRCRLRPSSSTGKKSEGFSAVSLAKYSRRCIVHS